MGHKVGLEKHYERYQEEDFERFPEYQKAIPFLTISDDERLKLENEKLKEKKSELEKRDIDVKNLEKKMKVLWEASLPKIRVVHGDKIMGPSTYSGPSFEEWLKSPE